MKFNPVFSFLAVVCLVGFAQTASAHGVQCGDLNVAHPYAMPSLGGLKTGGVYFKTMKNNGKQADQLVGAYTDVASSVDIHAMSLENNIMKMRAMPEVQLPAGEEQAFKHGQANGYHLMLQGLKKPLQAGDKFALTLQFKKAGDCQAEVWVEAPAADAHRH